MRFKLSNNTIFEPLLQLDLCVGCDVQLPCVVVFDEEGFPVELCHSCLVDLANELLEKK